MHQVFEQIVGELEEVIERLGVAITSPEPLGMQQSSWSYPQVSVSELQQEARVIIQAISQRAPEEVGENFPLLSHYVLRLRYVAEETIPQLHGNAGAATWAYSRTLGGLWKALEHDLAPLPAQEIEQSIQDSTRRARAMESKLAELKERSTLLDQMVTRIEAAHTAAQELPIDLQYLKETRAQIEISKRNATLDRDHVAEARATAESAKDELASLTESARDVLARCETAYASATSTGLAAAFSERSAALNNSVALWVAGLLAALIAGSIFSFSRMDRILELLSLPGDHGLILSVNLALAVLSVSGAVWFAWLSTKQIGQRFRLSEDYAFKASISRAYEGYRREAARIDKDLEKQLLSSALARLDEQPLRLVESNSFGSPGHELLASDLVKDAIKTVPGFAEKVISMASSALQGKNAATVSTSTVAANNVPSEQDESKV
ncbi:hypothetical protein [Pseudomonas viridiflava]|uniref:hypothetical protein n=1 Tax=Pseudomonas viridiflava TaxID=33069 RepID=UPI001F155A3B|nr:hypothetical protein [Pseudomonas viridiflava]